MGTKTEPHSLALSTEEATALTSGAGFWRTLALPELRIPALEIADGPHGLRKQTGAVDHLGVAASNPATCFPPAAALGSTWSVGLVERVGAAIGREAAAEGVGLLLGPGVDVKRAPLCGRNFEYFSEDPRVSGVLGAAMVRGIQSQGVGATLKHLVGNTQETDRGSVDSVIDERTLREIYLAPFESIIRACPPAAVMTAYNKLNGTYSSENPRLIQSVLRDEWGFDGVVISDWGAVHDPVAAAAAGLDLQMPPRDGVQILRQAIAEGRLDPDVVIRAAGRIAHLAGAQPAYAVLSDTDRGAHHALAVEAAEEAIVLLKNDGDLLPLDVHGTIAVIGELARSPRIQGGGSSRVEPTRIMEPLSEIRRLAADPGQVAFAPGYRQDDGEEDPRDLRAEAVSLAADAQTVVLFLGLPPGAESEGFDRSDMLLPKEQRDLLDAVVQVSSRIVVVLSNGGVVSVADWHDDVDAIVEGWLLGQGAGTAIARILFGEANPSGHLAETIPRRIEDTPTFLSFPGTDGTAHHGEGVFIGYRFYDAVGRDVAYPFGHGLSYTDFAFSDLHVTGQPGGEASVVLTVTNVGHVAGAAVPQLYVAPPPAAPRRPLRELRAFAKVRLEPGESTTMTFRLTERDFAYWSEEHLSWRVAPGRYEVLLGASARDIRLRAPFVHRGNGIPARLTSASTISEWLSDARGRDVLGAAAEPLVNWSGADGELRSAPISAAVVASVITASELEEAIRRLDRQQDDAAARQKESDEQGS